MRINLPGILLFGTMLLGLSGNVVAATPTDPIEELKECARTDDTTARIACFEALGSRVLGEESENTVSSADAESAVAEPVAVKAAVAEPAAVEAAVVEATAVEATVVETAPSQAESSPMPDDLGVEKKKEEKPAEKKSYRGHVRSCGQMSDDRWYFVFDSGQVWKQSGNGKYRFKECDFDVTITKDFFSYKMEIDGGKTLRVKRER